MNTSLLNEPAVAEIAPSQPKERAAVRARQPHNIDWVPATFIIAMHVGAIAGLFNFNWAALAVCVVLHWITGGLGITLCYHRLLTHRSLEVPKPVEYFLTICASLACQGGPLTWVATHRLHHAASDQSEDPHSPRDGFFWSHMGWCLHKVTQMDEKGGKERYAPDIAQDKGLMFFEKTHILWTFLLGGLLYAMGGWPFVIWGICVRLVLVYHCTWFVNSAAHVWGYKTYDAKDDSKNLWWVALVTYGEGWHNNHHAFQTSARHGLKWWEFDSTYLMIQVLQLLGLAKSIKMPSEYQLNQKAAA